MAGVIDDKYESKAYQIDSNKNTGGTWVDGHVVGGVVEELCSGVSLHIVGIVVTPTKLNVEPVFLGCCGVHHVLRVGKK